MNSFELAVRPASSSDRVSAVVPIIDGRSFVDLVTDIERTNDFDVVGGYDGIIPANYRFGSLDRYYLGLGDSWTETTSTAVLGCDCGEVGCWPGCVTINANPSTVTWSSFQQPFRPDRDYSALGPFEFERRAYEEAVNAAIKALAISRF